MFLEYALRTYELGLGGGRQSEVVLLEHRARPLHGHALVVTLVELLHRAADRGLPHVLLDVGDRGGREGRGVDPALALKAARAIGQRGLVGVEPADVVVAAAINIFLLTLLLLLFLLRISQRLVER